MDSSGEAVDLSSLYWCNKEYPHCMITKDSKCGQLFTGGNNFFKITQYPSRRVEIHFETGKKLHKQRLLLTVMEHVGAKFSETRARFGACQAGRIGR